MPIVRLTGFFSDDDGRGWSETHDKDGGAGTPDLTAILANFDNLMTTSRRPLLAADGRYIGCRASYKLANGTQPGDNLLKDPPVNGPQTYGGVGVPMNLPQDAVKMRLRNAASTAKTDVYLRGVWDQVIEAGVLQFVATPQGVEWKRRADIYAAALIAGGYGWVGIDPAATSRGNVTNYVQNENFTVTLTVAPTNGVVLPAVGTKLTVKVARVNRSKSALNTQLVCTVDSPTSLTTLEQIAVQPFDTAGTYSAYVKAFIPYAAISYYKSSSRKTGRPFGVPRGRSPAQTRI